MKIINFFILFLLSFTYVSAYSIQKNVEINYVFTNDSLLLWSTDTSNKIKIESNSVGKVNLDTHIDIDRVLCVELYDDAYIKSLLTTYTEDIKNKITSNCICQFDQNNLTKQLNDGFTECKNNMQQPIIEQPIIEQPIQKENNNILIMSLIIIIMIIIFVGIGFVSYSIAKKKA